MNPEDRVDTFEEAITDHRHGASRYRFLCRLEDESDTTNAFVAGEMKACSENDRRVHVVATAVGDARNP